MSALAVNPVTPALRIAVVAKDPAREALLARLVNDLGYELVSAEDATLVIANGMTPDSSRPAIALGLAGDDVAGQLPGDATPAQIDAAIRAVAVGLAVSLPKVPARRFAALDDAEPRILLTPRESEVLAAVSNGSTNKEIARDLGISRHTVKFHMESLMRKLHASSRAEAVSKSLRLKLLEPLHV
jgi:DNA-binding NarL/FixJ family response regulator